MDKLKMQSPNLVDANIDKIAALFPHFFLRCPIIFYVLSGIFCFGSNAE
jgi:uncharacterized membrane protein